ncbi:saccharopine dehydrogenase NADP-binding domain-containing protein [Nocardia otitidiscaviarum]|uniref:saccharopine dehydrogenase NADP-binding domain-containing protein n=1 Tax=Nocardia otitidiscaviarum TaxID=1823 RepID=UPI000AAC2AD7|nr:saccharopine dehydrogenase NADP-binding domain-containing protein [Nocardia otitidiscaviarum]
MPKIVVFGATGYTGRLTAEALIAQGDSPVLAGRDAAALATLAAELGGAATAVADVADPASVTALLERGDVLVTTVGPFLRHGGPALAAALAAGAHYLDSTGEGPFVRTVFDHDEQARAAGVALLTALGFDYVPGNLAAGLALREAPSAVRVDVGYFMDGPATSGGTRASVAGMLFERGFALRDGNVVTEPAAAHLRDFDVAGKPRTAVSIPGSEHFALPRTHPNLRSIDVFLGLPPVAAHGLRLGSRLAATGGATPAAETRTRIRTDANRQGLHRRPRRPHPRPHPRLGRRRSLRRLRPPPGLGRPHRRRPLRIHRPPAGLGRTRGPERRPAHHRRSGPGRGIRPGRPARRRRRSRLDPHGLMGARQQKGPVKTGPDLVFLGARYWD